MRTPTSKKATGVLLPEGVTASRLLHDVLRAAEARFPELAAARLPADPSRFRAEYAEALVRFEAARVASPARAAIAAAVADRAHEALVFVAEDGRAEPLAARMRRGAEPYRSRTVAFEGVAGWTPRVRYRGATYEGPALAALGEELVRRRVATQAAADALAASAVAPLVLRGHKFAVLGAAAELSPAALLLAAGAEVFWLDVAPPPAWLREDPRLSGTLTYAEDGVDLLAAPDRAAATIAAFAAEGAVNLVLSAYAPGGGREWRLAAAMNAVVRALEPGCVAGVGAYVSPTTPCVLADDGRRPEETPRWQRALAAARALRPSRFVRDEVKVARALVPLQGVSYQAAQYVEKTLAGERFAAFGAREGGAPLRVSTNVAPITATRSLEHPLFRAGFVGAARFGVEIFPPDTTRALAALLLVADLVGDGGRAAPGPRHVHGGVHTMAFALDEAIRVAAVLGLAERPALLGELVRTQLGGARGRA